MSGLKYVNAFADIINVPDIYQKMVWYLSKCFSYRR